MGKKMDLSGVSEEDLTSELNKRIVDRRDERALEDFDSAKKFFAKNNAYEVIYPLKVYVVARNEKEAAENSQHAVRMSVTDDDDCNVQADTKHGVCKLITKPMKDDARPVYNDDLDMASDDAGWDDELGLELSPCSSINSFLEAKKLLGKK